MLKLRLNKIVTSFFCIVAFSSQVQASQKTIWKIEVYERTSENVLVKVSGLNYVASKLESGVIQESGQSMIFFNPSSKKEGDIKGHLLVSLKSVSDVSAEISVQVWDSSGLGDFSSYYKSYFSTDQNVPVRKQRRIEFTQGDASKAGAFVNYVLFLNLLSVETIAN